MKPTLNQIGVHRDCTDHETCVLNHVVESDTDWVTQGHYGIVEGQVTGVDQRMTEAIIITARVKQIDHDGFLAACLIRAQGGTVTGQRDNAASHAVAFLLNNLEPSEANSLAGGTDVTDRAMTRVKNATIVSATNDFKGHFSTKIKTWEESNDRSRFSHGAQYMNRAQREVEVTRRLGLTKEQRAALEQEVGHMSGPSVLKTQTTVAARAILGNGS
jgi:hypothetical protein